MLQLRHVSNARKICPQINYKNKHKKLHLLKKWSNWGVTRKLKYTTPITVNDAKAPWLKSLKQLSFYYVSCLRKVPIIPNTRYRNLSILLAENAQTSDPQRKKLPSNLFCLQLNVSLYIKPSLTLRLAGVTPDVHSYWTLCDCHRVKKSVYGDIKIFLFTWLDLAMFFENSAIVSAYISRK